MRKNKLKLGLILILTICLCITLASCTVDNEYTVTYDCDHDYVMKSMLVHSGEKATEYIPDERKGYEFLYWTNNLEKFDFNTPINSNMTLVAVWAKKVNVIYENREKEFILNPDKEYTPNDFDIKVDNSTLLGFIKETRKGIEQVDFSKGFKGGDTIYADLMSDGLVVEKIPDKDEMQVVNYTGSSKNINIPSFYNGLPVTKIADAVFYNRKLENNNNIENIYFGKNINTICFGAFSNSEIKNLYITKNIETIEDNAFAVSSIENVEFEKDSKLKTLGESTFFKSKGFSKIILPDQLTILKSRTFEMCKDLQIVYIPNSVTTLENFIFGFCDNVTIYRQKKNSTKTYVDGIDWDRINPNDIVRLKVINVENSDNI